MRIVIRTDNEAFTGDPGAELIRIVRGVLDRLAARAYDPGVRYALRDINGNTVGWVDGIPPPR